MGISREAVRDYVNRALEKIFHEIFT
ncbi:MAG TPA: hypothetical protein ENF81_10585 [Thermotogaceae bacterium]|nr:hypothetical protein [Thermotogota bacterium]HEW92966.1 hypothetical protein [Thermotogaceae bacterium]